MGIDVPHIICEFEEPRPASFTAAVGGVAEHSGIVAARALSVAASAWREIVSQLVPGVSSLSGELRSTRGDPGEKFTFSSLRGVDGSTDGGSVGRAAAR